MIDVSRITRALYDQLVNDAPLSTIAKKIERAGYVNKAHDAMPWVGIYRGNVSLSPAALGRHSQSWGAQVSLIVILQVYNFSDAGQSEAQLDALIQAVQDAVWSDPTIGNTVDMVAGFEIEYSYKETDSKTVHEQWASMTIKADARTG